MKRGDRRGRLRHRERGDLPGLPRVLRIADHALVAADQHDLRVRIDEQGLECDCELRIDRAPLLAVVDRAQYAPVRPHRDPGAAAGLIHDSAQVGVHRRVVRRLPGAARVRRSQDGSGRSNRDEHVTALIRGNAREVGGSRRDGMHPMHAVLGTKDRAIAAPDEQHARTAHEQAAIQLGIDDLRHVYRCGRARGGRARRCAGHSRQDDQRGPQPRGVMRHRCGGAGNRQSPARNQSAPVPIVPRSACP